MSAAQLSPHPYCYSHLCSLRKHTQTAHFSFQLVYIETPTCSHVLSTRNVHPPHRPPTLPVTSQPLNATIHKQPIDITLSPNSWADSASLLQQARPRTLEAPQPASGSHPFCPRVGASCRVGDPCLCQVSCSAGGKEPACQCRRLKRRRLDPWIRKIPWRRIWQPTPILLPGESHGQRSLAVYSPWGRKE